LESAADVSVKQIMMKEKIEITSFQITILSNFGAEFLILSTTWFTTHVNFSMKWAAVYVSFAGL
jgi:hypothetical protein